MVATLPNELEEREKYLISSKQHRLDYMMLVAKFNDWTHEAEIRLQHGNHGIDYENIMTDLEEHKIFFSTEPTIKDLVSKQIQAAADKIWPSLNKMEQEELSRELQHHTQVLKNTLNSAKSQRAQLEQDGEVWKSYCQMNDKIKTILSRIECNDDVVANLAGLHFNMQKIAHAKNELKVSLFFFLSLPLGIEIENRTKIFNNSLTLAQKSLLSLQSTPIKTFHRLMLTDRTVINNVV